MSHAEFVLVESVTASGSVARGWPSSRLWGLIGVAVLCAVALRVAMMLLFSPMTDVFYFDREAAQALLSGADPYSHTFTTVPMSLETPGAAGVFAYLPFTLVYLVPFYLIGDIRLGFVLADVAIGLLLFYQGGRWSALTSVVYLLMPFTVVLSTVYINNLLIAALFFSVFAALEKRGRTTAGSVSMGLAMATNQLAWLAFPFVAYWYVKSGRGSSLLVSVLTAATIVTPFLLWNPAGLLYSTIAFQFSRPSLALVSKVSPMGFNVNISLDELFITAFHTTVPAALRVGLMVLLLAILLAGTRGFRSSLLRCSFFSTAGIFVLPNNLFWSYAELPLIVFFIFLASREIPSFVKKRRQAKT